MNPFIDKKLSELRNVIHNKKRDRESRQIRDTDILNTMERVIDGTDGRIRLITGYKKKLQGVMQTSLEYTDALIDQIPRAIEINSTTYVSNPYVNAFFPNIHDLQTVFSRSSEIREFLEDFRNHELGESCALLCMHMTEKTVMGMELSGDIMKKDVRQVAVNFSDHRIYSPTPNETETRQGLKQCLFDGLVTNALGRIMELKLSNHRLQTERQMLQAKLRRLHHSKHHHQGRQGTDATSEREIEETQQQLRKTEDDLTRIHSASPQVSLEQVIDVFSHPESFVRLNRRSLRLNKMGIKISSDSHQRANDLDLTEAVIGNEVPRVITLAKFPKDELLPRKEFSLRH